MLFEESELYVFDAQGHEVAVIAPVEEALPRRLDRAWPADQARHAEAAFAVGGLFPTEPRIGLSAGHVTSPSL